MAERSGANGDTSKNPTINPSFGFKMVINGIKAKFSSVHNMSTVRLDELIRQQQDAEHNKLVVVDVRPDEEFNVSHIPSAVRIDWQTQDMTELKRVMEQQGLSSREPIDVVMYCSVGYRSSMLADRFRHQVNMESTQTVESTTQTAQTGVTKSKMRIYNLEGSLFKWANEGREMVDGTGSQTKFVHPYSMVWGQLVSKDIRRWEGPHT